MPDGDPRIDPEEDNDEDSPRGFNDPSSAPEAEDEEGESE